MSKMFVVISDILKLKFVRLYGKANWKYKSNLIMLTFIVVCISLL